MEFALEMIVKSTIGNLRIAEVPTTLYPDSRGRPPHLRSWRDGWRSLRFYLLLSPEGLFLYPGVVLAALSGAASLFLFFTNIQDRLGRLRATYAYHHLYFDGRWHPVGVFLEVRQIGRNPEAVITSRSPRSEPCDRYSIWRNALSAASCW